MYMKLHSQDGSTILALCDREHLGKVFREGELRLDLKTYSSFYKGELVTEEDARRALRDADSLNLVGKRSIALAEKLGIISKAAVRKIGGVPHVQVYRIRD